MQTLKFVFTLLLFVIASSNIDIVLKAPNVQSHQAKRYRHKQLCQQWKHKFNKNWTPEQAVYRESTFSSILQYIESHNAELNTTYYLGLNAYSDFTDQQKVQFLLNSEIMKASQSLILTSAQAQQLGAFNSLFQINWVTLNKVTDIRNQGQCGSCYAFSAIASVESMYKIKYNQTVDLSEQQIVDCSGAYGNQGCNGGWPSFSLNYILYNGISTESEYPYAAKNQQCKKVGGSFKISSIKYSRGCQEIQAALLLGPTSVAVQGANWFNYKSGIFSACSTTVDHAVLLVASTSTYWLIKNSWGPTWGQNGYIKLALGNTCGICQYATSFPG